jgi:hypothetical protein
VTLTRYAFGAIASAVVAWIASTACGGASEASVDAGINDASMGADALLAADGTSAFDALQDRAVDASVCYGPAPLSSDGAAACNAITSCAPFVQAVAVPGTMPSFVGGSIEAGTYDLTALEDYGDPDASANLPQQMAQTWVVTANGSAFDVAGLQAYPDPDAGIFAGAASYALTPQGGQQAMLEMTCPGPTRIGFSIRYTVTGSGAGATFRFALSNLRRYTMTKR